ISPFFVVSDVGRSIAFYRDRLGFEVTWSDPRENPFSAILVRDGAQLFVKHEGGIVPMPNSSLHPHLRSDAFVFTADPDGLASEVAERGAPFSKPLADTSDGLRGFEITDPDGYVLFFGEPRGGG